MGQDSKIQWTHHTFNPWWGCTKISPGCAHCYAESFSKRYGHAVWGKDAPRRTFGEKHWRDPLKWNAVAEKAGERRRVFCASMADVFEDREDLDPERIKLFKLIRQTPHLDWLLLTKRPFNVWLTMARLTGNNQWESFLPDYPNVWLGTTCEDQRHAEQRIPYLSITGASVKFISVEPQLERISLRGIPMNLCIDWVICGGESGPGARPFDPDWARSLSDDCASLGAAFFMKQLGGVRDKRGELEQLPEDLRIREFPIPFSATVWNSI